MNLKKKEQINQANVHYQHTTVCCKKGAILQVSKEENFIPYRETMARINEISSEVMPARRQQISPNA
jgi:hypothetical protein